MLRGLVIMLRCVRKVVGVVGIVTAMALLIAPTAAASSASVSGSGSNSGIGYLLADPTGKIIVSQNADQPFVPASTLKLLTSLSAIHTLGKNFKFKTEFFLGPDKTLRIKGSGDPLLTSEILETLSCDLASTLLKRGISTIRAIEVDNLFFEQGIDIPGTGSTTRSYDAGVSALTANFNTVSFKRDPQTDQYISAEPQTPLLDFTRTRILASGLDNGRVLLSTDETCTYAGELVKFFLEKQGIRVSGEVTQGQVEIQDICIHTHVSPYTLTELVRRLLKFSNNFMANQIFLTAGAEAFSAPATLEKSVRVLKTYATDTLGIEAITISEGSGLSRTNTISPQGLLKVLMAFKPYHELMTQEANEFYKTGTLSGVRTRAGYFTDNDKNLYPFVIMVNQSGKDYSSIKEKLRGLTPKNWKKDET